MQPDFTPELIERFWSYVDQSPGHGPWGDCWLWTRYRNSDGYGKFADGTKPRARIINAHRIAYVLEYGPIPEDRPNILHSCDNPACCNPRHLSAGTQHDNMQDMTSKRRYPRKLSDDDIRAIQNLADNGVNQYDIAARFSVSQGLVSVIARRKRRYANIA